MVNLLTIAYVSPAYITIYKLIYYNIYKVCYLYAPKATALDD
jgi:hypothetical protein